MCNGVLYMTVTFINKPIPESGHVQALLPGVLWLRMPLPFALDHINLYLLDDGEAGYALIDTGISTSKVESVWEEVLIKLDKPISRIIVTHLHPDHIGMAGYIAEKFKIKLYMSYAEYYAARALSGGSRGADDWQDDEYLKLCGMPEDYIANAKENRQTSPGVGAVVRPIPLQFERLQENDILSIGGQSWQVIIGRGHSPEHVCLFNKKENILISGDHVLPGISPNIGVYSTEPNANPLRQYLDTLPQFKDLPETTLVLPSHKQPFRGLHTRVNQLISHHHQHLEALLEYCDEGKTIKQCLPILFKRKLTQHNMFFAIAESFAHLNYLYYAQQCTRTINAQGQYIYTRISN